MHYILAQDDGSGLIQLVVLLIIAIVGGLAEAMKKKREKAQQQRQQEQLSRQPTPPAGDTQPMAHEPREIMKEPGRRRMPPPPPPTRRQQQAQVDQGPVEVKRYKPIPAPQRPQRRVAPPAVPEAPPGQRRVSQGLAVQQAHLEQENDDRLRRLGTLRPVEEDTVAIESRILHIRPSQAVESGAQVQYRVDLRTRQAARTAIIFAEIFGKPKCLRTEAEKWEE